MPPQKRSEAEARLEECKEQYYNQLISNNKNAKKYPKKYLTEFENLGLGLLEKQYIQTGQELKETKPEHEARVAKFEKRIAEAEKAEEKEKLQSQLAEIIREREEKEEAVGMLPPLNGADKKLCEGFLEHAIDNRNFDQRLGRAISGDKQYVSNKKHAGYRTKKRFLIIYINSPIKPLV